MKTLTLNNGYQIPVLGTGTNTFGKENHDFSAPINHDTTELRSAIELGYRLIDTAIYYRNESVIGKAVRESGIDRSEFFITSKIPEKDEFSGTDDRVHQSVQASLSALDLDYIDLYLIHFPRSTDEENLRVWTVLESYVDQGLIKSIGVSNFNVEQLQALLKRARIKPVLNQFLSYPGHHNQALIDFCQGESIIPEAYQSLKKITPETQEILSKMSEKYGKTWSQVVLNYQINENMVVIPKSHNASHQKDNVDIFDFVLSDEDQLRIKQL